MVGDANVTAATMASEESHLRLTALRGALDLPKGRSLRIVGIGAGAWGAVFVSMLQRNYGDFIRDCDISVYRREGRKVSQAFASDLLDMINSHDDQIRMLRNSGKYLKYVEAKLGDRVLSADEILRDGFCANITECPLVPLKVVTNLEEAVWGADILICSLPSTEVAKVFQEIGRILIERDPTKEGWPFVISLTKGAEYSEDPQPHVLTPTGLIQQACGYPSTKLSYLGGPNIAKDVWLGSFATARLCSPADPVLMESLAKFLSNESFVVWPNADVVGHEVAGSLKNIYAIGAGLLSAATNENATSKAVYFSNCCAEMVLIMHLLSSEAEYLAGPLLADTYVTLLSGRNSWYGRQIGQGLLKVSDGAYVPGKGLIQGVSSTSNFYDLLSDSRVSIPHPVTGEKISPIALLPTLRALNEILSEDGSIDSTEWRKKKRMASMDSEILMLAEPATKVGPAERFLANLMQENSQSDPAAMLALPRLASAEYYDEKLVRYAR